MSYLYLTQTVAKIAREQIEAWYKEQTGKSSVPSTINVAEVESSTPPEGVKKVMLSNVLSSAGVDSQLAARHPKIFRVEDTQVGEGETAQTIKVITSVDMHALRQEATRTVGL